MPDAALRWALLQAFAIDATPAAPPPDGEATARRLDVAARIGAVRRHTGFAGEARAAAVSELRAREAAAEVARAAAGAGIRCCFLKGAALELRGVLLAGARGVSDVDVLVARADAAALVLALQASGFAAGAGEAYSHHLPPLVHPRLGMVEVHVELPGVAAPGRRGFATLGDLGAAGLLESCSELGGSASLPAPPALVAHLVAHALGQHGFRPAAYPPLRVVGDLIDLGLARDDARARNARAGALELLAGVPAAEAEALFAGTAALATGDLEILAGDSAAALVLRHLIAGALDERYRESLKLQELAHPLGAGPRWRARAAATWQALALSRGQIDAIYGRPRSGWGYLGRRLWRPFDLLRRAARARAATR